MHIASHTENSQLIRPIDLEAGTHHTRPVSLLEAAGLVRHKDRISDHAEPPLPHHGWIKKQARKSIFKNWQRRFMTVDFGLLKYFDNYDEKTKQPQNCKGTMLLEGARIFFNTDEGDGSHRIHIEAGVDGEDDLTFECYSLQEAEQWTSIIANHVVYAIQTKQSAANDGATFDAGDLIGEVPREKKGYFIIHEETISSFFSMKEFHDRYVILSEGLLYYYSSYDEDDCEPVNLKRIEHLAKVTIGIDAPSSEIYLIGGRAEPTVTLKMNSKDAILYGDTLISEWKASIQDHIDFASKNMQLLQSKIKAISNSTTSYRERFYGYTMTGSKDYLKNKIFEKVHDGIYPQMAALAQQLIDFLTSDPLSSKVLAHVVATSITFYGLLSTIFNLLALNVAACVISFLLFSSGLIFICYELRLVYLPMKYYRIIFRDFRILFSPYGRVNTYLFLSILIGSQSSLAGGAFCYEIFLLGAFLTACSLRIFHNTWMSRTLLSSWKKQRINLKILKSAFNAADASGNGELDKEEFGRFLTKIFGESSNNDMELALIEIDKTRNFEVSWKEFILWYCDDDSIFSV